MIRIFNKVIKFLKKKLDEIEFESCGRYALIAEVLETIDTHITGDEIEEISKLLYID